jgi:hypothetical protein
MARRFEGLAPYAARRELNIHFPRHAAVRTARLALDGRVLLALCEHAFSPPSLSPPPPSLPTSLPAPDQAMEIVALVQPGPATYFPGPDGKPAVSMLICCSSSRRTKTCRYALSSPTTRRKCWPKSPAGNAHIGAGGLYRPASKQPEFDAGIVASANANALPNNCCGGVRHQSPAQSRIETLWTTGYYAIEPTLIYNGDGFKPSKWTDLRGQTVAYVDGTHLEPELAALRSAYPEVQWNAMKVPSVDALISQVSDGTVDYAVVASNEAAVVRNAYLGYETAFTLGRAIQARMGRRSSV